MDEIRNALALGPWITPPDQPPESLLPRLLGVMRRHFDMEVAFISHFIDGRRRFEYVDADPSEDRIVVGGSDALEDSYCQAVVDGRLPELILDAQNLDAALEFPGTKAFPVGAHMSVPLVLSSGTVYGTFCCFSRHPDHSLTGRDLEVLHTLADVASEILDAQRAADQRREAIRQRIEEVLDQHLLSMVFQPIFDLERGQISGFESLARFNAEPYRTPDLWFREAREIGLHSPLELKAIELALQSLDHLPPETYLAVNVSPKVLLEKSLDPLLSSCPLHRLVLEVTENDPIDDYDAFNSLLDPLRSAGLRLAVDDAGSGYASFRHILLLKPDIIKLDISITRGIDHDPLRESLAVGLVAFSHANHMKLIAEGVDRPSELDTLRTIGADYSQGYLLSHPLSSNQMQATHLWT